MYHCIHCNYEWKPRGTSKGEFPKTCPSCHSKIWNRQPNRKKSDATKEKIRLGHLGQPSKLKGRQLPPEQYAKLVKNNRAKMSKPSFIEHLKQGKRKGSHHTQEVKELMRRQHIGMKASEETKGKMTAAHLERWSDPVYKERTVKNIRAGAKRGTSKLEKDLEIVLDAYFPDEYLHTGQNTDYMIGTRLPDFLYWKGDKRVILAHGDFYHYEIFLKEFPNLTMEDVEHGDIEYYAQCGYKCLIVWEYELNDIEKVREKVENFHRECEKFANSLLTEELAMVS